MKQFFKVTILSGILTLIRMCLGFIVGKIVAIYTGPAGIAMLGQLQSVIGIINGIATAPVGSGIVRYTSEHHLSGFDSCAPWWRAALRISSIIYVIISLLLVINAGFLSKRIFLDEQYAWVIIIACGVIPFAVANTLIASVLNGQQLYRQYISLCMMSVVITTLILIALIVNFNLKGALLATALNSAVAGIVLISFCIKKAWFNYKYWFGPVYKTHIINILGYSFMGLVTALSMPTAILLVRKLLINEVGWNSAGQWQAVWKISEVYLGVVTIALSTYFLPKLSILKDSKLIKKEVNSTSIYIIILTSCLAAIIYFCRDLSLNLLFTSEFKGARNLFLYQLLGDVIKIAGFIYAYPLIAQGRVKVFIISEIIFSFSFVVLAYILIQQFGVQGANIAYLFNYLLYFIFAFTFTNFINVRFFYKNEE
ncbi:O-antigen translocase [Dryocola clanedunensis]|uniref:O-antigen translocase n=1 Tax=Cedecea sulfonylureivorans TaxID=3051154 RepID=UPI001927798A|nr:O-antigen translocase [Cedecea sulfonylureivorans]